MPVVSFGVPAGLGVTGVGVVGCGVSGVWPGLFGASGWCGGWAASDET